MTDPVVVVGGGLAGGKAVETLREEGYDGPLVLLTEEPERPYERPPLSKGYLLGNDDREKARVHEGGWYDAHDVDLRTGVRATGLDPRRQLVSPQVRFERPRIDVRHFELLRLVRRPAVFVGDGAENFLDQLPAVAVAP